MQWATLSLGRCTFLGLPTCQLTLFLATTWRFSSTCPPGTQASHPNSSPTVEFPVAENLITDSLGPSSCRAYRAGQSEFIQFCHRLSVTPLPVQEPLLILFVAHLSLRLAHSSVRWYLSAVCHMHIAQGFGDPLAGTLRLQLALKGLKRSKPREKNSWLPVTPYVLRVKAVLDREPHRQDNIMLWAACCLGFFTFLRLGEMTVPSANSCDPSWHLTPMDVAVDNLQQPSLIQLSLKCSKTDQTRQHVKLFIGRTNNELCMVAAMLAYLAVRGFDHGPLFRSEDGQPLTCAKLVSLLKAMLTAAGIDSTHYSAHSFRIGQQPQQQPMKSVIPRSRHWEDGLVIPICDTFEGHIKPWHSCQRA